MSCWRRTTVLRVPAARIGFQSRRQWDDFLKKHEEDFDWEPGYFNESLCDSSPLMPGWSTADSDGPDCPLNQVNPDCPGIVPGPFLDYHLDEIIPLPPEDNHFHQNDRALPLTESEKEEYLPLFRTLFPRFTIKDMESVRRCEYEWYDGTNPPYLYSETN